MEVQYTCDAVTGPSVCSVVFFLPGGQSGTRSHTSHKQRDAGCHTQLFGVDRADEKASVQLLLSVHL